MEKSRLEILQEFVENDPHDSFSRYALGQEYMNLDRIDKAIVTFERLAETDPDYVAVYYHLGGVLEHAGRKDEAKEIYQKGIAVSDKGGDMHAKGELMEALDMLEGEFSS